MESPIHYFSSLTDPRVERTREHDLSDILFLAIASILCGAASWNEMEEFGKAKEEWLKKCKQRQQWHREIACILLSELERKDISRGVTTVKRVIKRSESQQMIF